MASFWYNLRHGFIARNGPIGWLIVANAAVFLAMLVVNLGFFFSGLPTGGVAVLTREWLGVPYDWALLAQKPWTLATYMFVHDLGGILHILFNMLWMYWIGRILLSMQPAKHIWNLYILGGLAGAVFYLAMNSIPTISQPAYGMIGASAAVTAIIVATATLLPDFKLHLLFIGPVALKWIAIVMVALDVLFLPAGNTGGRLAHLGGALLGYAYIRSMQSGTNLGAPIDWLRELFKEDPNARSKRNMRVKRPLNRNQGDGGPAGGAGSSRPSQQEIDRILDKMAKVGFAGLSKAEKETLNRAGE